MIWILIHKTCSSVQHTCHSFAQAQREFYSKVRDNDGSIPWDIFCNGYQVDPTTGNIICCTVYA